MKNKKQKNNNNNNKDIKKNNNKKTMCSFTVYVTDKTSLAFQCRSFKIPCFFLLISERY